MSSSGHVKVVVRTRPTAKFAHDMIQLEKDGKVEQVCKKKKQKHKFSNTP